MASKISPISGFPEYLPAQQLAFDAMVKSVAAVYELYGYVPLETPAVERIDTLTSKGIDSKEVYALRRLNVQGADDDGSKELALRFDLTVPLARYVAQHYANLTFPFRRYQVQPVWRGERPKNGRYRQFYQFDLDYIGEGQLPVAADAEVIAAAHEALNALGVGQFTMRINNRKFLRGLLEIHGYATAQTQAAALKVVDDLEKLEEAQILQGLKAIDAEANAEGLLRLMKTWQHKPFAEILRQTEEFRSNEMFAEGADELATLLKHLEALLEHSGGCGAVVVDVTIARGLDYYTGMVLETRLEAAPELGSICSGGRYENLTASLGDRDLPGVGISIGLSRLAGWLMQQPHYSNKAATTAQVLVADTGEDTLPYLSRVASQLRAGGVAVEQAFSKQGLGQQLQKAEKRGLEWAVSANAEDMAARQVQLKNLKTRSQQALPLDDLVPTLHELLHGDAGLYL